MRSNTASSPLDFLFASSRLGPGGFDKLEISVVQTIKASRKAKELANGHLREKTFETITALLPPDITEKNLWS